MFQESEIFIENYKGQSIYYNEALDKFTCDMERDSKVRVAKRLSLKALKMEVDKFVKANIGFRPFRVMQESYSGNLTVYNVESIRTDGMFVVRNEDSRIRGAEHISPGKLEEEYFAYDNDLIEQIRILNDEKEATADEYQLKIDALVKSAKKLDLSEYKFTTE